MKKSKSKNISVRKLYDIWAEDYDNNNLVMFLEEQLTSKLFRFKGKKILDLGCGTGRYAIPLAKHNIVVAVDFNKKMLDIARNKARQERVKIKFIQQDVTKFKAKEKFDIILSMFVHDQVGNLEKVGRVIFSASRKGTELFISNVHPRQIRRIVSRGKSEIIPGYLIQEHYHPLSEYLKVFSKFGFELVRSREIVFEKKYFSMIEAPVELRNRALGILYHFRRVR